MSPSGLPPLQVSKALGTNRVIDPPVDIPLNTPLFPTVVPKFVHDDKLNLFAAVQ